MFLKEFIQFSIDYKKLVGDVLDINLKLYIWSFYKKKIAYDIIRKYFNKITSICEDCLTTKFRWSPYIDEDHKLCYKQNFYYVDCCSHGTMDEPCHEKNICLSHCNFKIICTDCSFRYSFVPEEHAYAFKLGWNLIEGLEKYISYCPACQFKNTIKLKWHVH